MIVNLTQHMATPAQLCAGVVDVPAPMHGRLVELLTFDQLPARAEIEARAGDIAQIAALAFEAHPTGAMIGGAPWLMAPLEAALLDQGIQPLYAFSVRESKEQTMPDGTVCKTNVFNHKGFILYR